MGQKEKYKHLIIDLPPVAPNSWNVRKFRTKAEYRTGAPVKN